MRQRPLPRLAASFVPLLFLPLSASASILYTNNFNSLSDGNLVGQGFNQTGSSSTNPVKVTSGTVALQDNGQDVNTALSSSVTAGHSVYVGLTINVASAATGDYFLHFAPTITDTNTQSARLFLQAATGGYVVGMAFGSTGATYGTTVLPFNTNEQVVFRYDIVSGATNDTAALYVNPTDSATEGNNTTYMTAANNSVSEPGQTFATVNFRQGAQNLAPFLTLDNLTVATTFAEAVPAAAPEPASLGVLAAGGLLLLRRRK